MVRLELALALLKVQLVPPAHPLVEVGDFLHHLVVLSHALNESSHLVIFMARLFQVQTCEVELLVLLSHFQFHLVQLILKSLSSLDFIFQVAGQTLDFVTDLR